MSPNRSAVDLHLNAGSVLERKKESLLKIFQSYASFAGSANIYRLKSIKFTKLLRNAEILREGVNNLSMNYSFHQLGNTTGRTTSSGLNKSTAESKLFLDEGKIDRLKRCLSPLDVDLIFIKVTGGSREVGTHRSTNSLELSMNMSNLGKSGVDDSVSSTRSMDFEQFLKAVELIAEKLFPEFDLDSALSQMIERHFGKLESTNKQVIESVMNGTESVKRLLAMLKDPEIVSFDSTTILLSRDIGRCTGQAQGISSHILRLLQRP